MTEISSCPHCGKPVPASALGGLCPECMLKVGATPQTGEVGPNGTLVVQSALTAPPSLAEIAEHFPQLELLECLGRGGMGVVYKARQKNLNRIVALKILAPEKESDARFAGRFAREAEALARLNHPNIVTVHDFGEAGGLFFLLMEFVDGVSLRPLLREKQLRPEQALAIVPRICEALQYAHDQGIVHRDIKPENVLLDKQGRVKIADFGIAKIVGQPSSLKALTEDQQVIGTPHYMAPEQVEKPQLVDHRADIYSLGVVFYEMLTGELPLGKFQPPSHRAPVDGRLDEVVLHALEKEPDRRYQHASQVKTDVETIAALPSRPSSSRREEAPSSKSEIRRPKPEVDQCLLTSATRWVTIARWTARIFSLLLLAFYGFFVFAEGLPPIGSQPQGVQLSFIALGFMLAGFVVGWKREGTAALLIALGWTLWQVSESSVRWNLFQTPLPIAALYGYCWWAAQGRRTIRLVTVAAVLTGLFGLGRLFCPANVFVSGTIIDAATGAPISNAELRLLHPHRRVQREEDRPNARSGKDGRFNLYVGWYAASQPVAIAAAGYETLKTTLGARPLGERRVKRDFQLSLTGPSESTTTVSPEQIPPVVIRTDPESGASDVDPALTELRVTFSKPMQDGGWSWTRLDEQSFPETTGQPRYLEDGRTCVLPVGLQPGRCYAIWLNTDRFANFKDTNGLPSVPYLLIFQTSVQPQTP